MHILFKNFKVFEKTIKAGEGVIADDTWLILRLLNNAETALKYL